MSGSWSKLKSPPFSQQTELLSCNNDIWSIPTGYSSVSDSIYQYSFSTNKWIEIITKTQAKTHRFNHATIDTENQLIYAQNIQYPHSELIRINLNTKTIQTIGTLGNMKIPSMIYANGNIHFFSPTKYFISDKESNTLEKRATYSNRAAGFMCIFIKSKSCIMTTIIDHTTAEPSFIAEFSLMDYKWTKRVKIPFNSAIVSTKNDQYIIFMGGYDKTKALWTDSILIYDIIHNIFKKSIIKCPSKSFFTATLTRDNNKDELLTIGYINKCFKLSQFSHIQPLPFYLLNIIVCYVCNEKINIISVEGESEQCHWMINVDQILQSTK